MKKYATRAARARFSEMLRDAHERPVIVLRHGRCAAVVMSPLHFEEYLRLKRFINAAGVIAGVEQAAGLIADGDGTRGLGALRALAPYWRRTGIRSAPRDRVRPDKPRSPRSWNGP